MNAKCVFALILALQVSTSLCEVKEPSAELAAKYDEMKRTFLSRLGNAYQKAKAAAVARLEENPSVAPVLASIKDMQNREEYNAVVQSVDNLIKEGNPAVEKARNFILAAYEEHLRPHIGDYLNDFINAIKPQLDKVMPAQ